MKKQLFLIVLAAFALLPVSAQTKTPTPLSVYQKDGIIVGSYDFQAIEPFLKMQNDTTYIVNFWATWCKPCIEELPHFEKIASNYSTQKIKVILISLDMARQVESSLIPFIKRKKLRSQVIHLRDPDANAWISKVDPNWSGAIPATVIYNKDKRKFYEQSFSYEALEKEIALFNNH
jgi:thiol-disulfide isomerase/thioredoxin